MPDPMARVRELKAKGMNNNQIIDQLQREGLSSGQIFDLLSQDDAPQQQQPMQQQQYAAPQQSYNPPAPRAPTPQVSVGADTEELIEAIIDEKWNDLMSDINKVISWKDATEGRITKMEQQMNDMQSQFDKLHQAVIGKVGEYDQHILDVGAEVKAMEKVFSKVLPVFTDNVAELSRITENFKQVKK